MPRLSDAEKRERKIAREIAATVRQIERPRKKKKPLTPRARESHRKQQARWAKANPDCIRDAQRKWRDKQESELLRQYDRDRYAANPEKKKARSRAHHAANRDAINAKRRAKAAANRDAINEARRAKRAAQRAEREGLRKPAKKIGPAIARPYSV